MTVPKLATNSDVHYWLASVYCSTRPHNLPIHSNCCFHLSGMDSFSFENCDTTEQQTLIQYLQLKCCSTLLVLIGTSTDGGTKEGAKPMVPLLELSFPPHARTT